MGKRCILIVDDSVISGKGIHLSAFFLPFFNDEEEDDAS